MQLKEFNILLDIKKYNKTDYFEVVQGDLNSNVLNITLVDGLNPYNLAGANVEIVFSKPDGTTVIQDNSNGVVVINELEGKIQCTLNTNTIASPGRVIAEVRVSEGEILLTSARFGFYVRKAIFGDDTIKSTNEWPLLKKLLEASESEELRETEESIRQSNEEERIQNEQTREDNELNRNINEEQRIVKETERINSENERIANEEIRRINEQNRQSNEEIRSTNEQNRQSNEVTRNENEDIRISQEESRVLAEESRESNETIRQQNENERESNETIRISNEDERELNESNRVSAETDRVQAEITRQEGYNQAIDNFSTDSTQAINDFNTQGQQAINDFVTETERVEAIYPTRLTNVENDLAQHKLDYVSQRQQDQLKVAKVEKELNDYKKVMSQVNINHEPKQKASGYGTISLPPNAANGQVSVTAKGLTATNFVKNGNFANGATNWSAGGATISASQNVLMITGTGTDIEPRISQRLPIKRIGQKLYVRMKAKVTNSECKQIALMVGTLSVVQDNPVANTEYFISNVLTMTNDGSDVWCVPFHGYDSAEVAAGKVMEVKEVMVVDLTTMFGAGNEPTKEECDKMFSRYIDGTKSTVSAIRAKSVGKNLFDLKQETGLNKEIINLDGRSNVWSMPNYAYISNYFIYDRYFEHGMVYTLSLDAKYKVGTTRGFGVNVDYTDNTRDFYYGESASNWIRVTQVIGDTNKQIKMIRIGRSANNEYSYIDLDTIQLEKGAGATPYEPYKESTSYVVAKDKDNKIVNLMSHEGVHDEIDLDKRELIKRIGVDEEGLTYQLAEPEIIPIEVSGNIVAHPNGTVYIEHGTFTAGVYGTNGVAVTNTGLPIKTINKITKIDYITGLEYDLDVSTATISEDKLLFTHPDLITNDIVFFDYDYDLESAEGLATVEFYDSRYVIEDKSVTGKFYTWKVEVDNGVPSITVVEV